MTEYEEEICNQLGIKIEPRNTPHEFEKYVTIDGVRRKVYFIYGMYHTFEEICMGFCISEIALRRRKDKYPNNPEKWIEPTYANRLFNFNGIDMRIKDIAVVSGVCSSAINKMIRKKGWEYTKNYYENKIKSNGKSL